MIRLALLGCGSHSKQQHAAPLARYVAEHPGEVELVAACDLDGTKADYVAKTFGFKRAYTDLDTMLDAEKPDGCACIVPVPLVVEVSERLLRRGVPCVIEKPPGGSLAQVRQLAAIAGETGTPHLVSVNRRSVPYLNEAIEWVRDRGGVRYVRGTMVRHNRREPDYVWSTGIHAIDAVRHIAGDVACWRGEVVTIDGLSARWYLIDLEFASGCRGRVEFVTTAGMTEESYELFGEGIRARVSSSPVWQSIRLQCWEGNELVIDRVSPEGEPIDVTCGAYHEVVEFVAALSAGRAPRPSLADVLPSAEIGFALAAQAGIVTG